ncbi:MerR family transcriptional regulator [Pelotomaculum isophthalicicum JI]|uniref:MerR family transcriptional regulator n=1 Tax=Pelotomaculum isophthalicicum JI TaxID=947010 RepID=A0A9X4H2V2_9FIRM|nr:MerR family transcriptional regulator [Pelotomaculum isophthalicicum]MDF9408656.1 MerR family transcriptional regulator [Pelotomaculum isophthalicicum JI]
MDNNLRMKEIVEKTGENKSTVLHYIRMGLLPEPVRTSKNMAYYPEIYIKLINIIRTLQSRFFLPLHAIKRILDFIGQNPTIDRAVHIYELLYKMAYAEPGDPERTYSRKELLQETGMKSGELENLEQLQLLVPFENDMYNNDDLVVAKSLMMVKKNHIPLEGLDFLPDLLGQVAARSSEFRDMSIKGLNDEEEWEITRFLSGNLIGFSNYLVRRFLYRELKKKYKAGPVEAG